MGYTDKKLFKCACRKVVVRRSKVIAEISVRHLGVDG
jgi:hypothetical protein